MPDLLSYFCFTAFDNFLSGRLTNLLFFCGNSKLGSPSIIAVLT